MKLEKIIVVIAICMLFSGCKFIGSSSLQKGTAKWWASNFSEESKERGVFVSYYEALPFEYEDSIFHIKLVFKEVYTEWDHWFEWKDTALTNCLFWQNSETIKDQHLIGIYDSSCVLGITLNNILNHTEKERYNSNDSILTYADILSIIANIDDYRKCYRGGWKPLSFLGNELYFNQYWESVCGNIPYFYLDRYYFVWKTTGLNAVGGEFADTIKLPITSSLYYDKQCGYDHAMHFPFGELVFIRKK